jgi:23S rRNA (adenine2030-N6)-methyltransferase
MALAASTARGVNYRHAFHAGNFADVLKHAALVLALERLTTKPAPLFYLDTHAGAARYDLAGEAARRTGEAEAGIRRLLLERAPHPALATYLALMRELNAGAAAPTVYPGSPWIARKLLRTRDRIELHETHAEAHRELRRAMSGDQRVTVADGDGWGSLKAALPPRERRGLVLVDPPFEAKDEFVRLARGLRHATRRFATGTYLAWYPIKTRAPIRAFHDEIVAAGVRRVLSCELLIRAPAADETPSPRLAGCGLLIINPPWTLTERLADLLPWLAPRLAQGDGAGARLETLVGE